MKLIRQSPTDNGSRHRPAQQLWPEVRVVLAVGVLMMVLALGIAGCSADGDDSAGSNHTSADSESANSSSDSNAVGEGSADDGVGSAVVMAVNAQTFSALAMGINPPPEYYQVLKECMNAQGFEFEVGTPERLIPQSELIDLLEEVAGLDHTSSLFRNRYGYGVTTIAAYLDVGRSAIDPNEEMFLQLSASEQHAWIVALLGPEMARHLNPDHEPTEEDLGEEPTETPTEFGGCYAQADTVWDIDLEATEEESQAIVEKILQISGSEEFVVLDQQWARCAADEGYDDLTSIISVTELLVNKLHDLQTPGPIHGPQIEKLLGVTEAELDRMTTDEMEDRLEALPYRYTLEDLELLQMEELEMAHRLKDCDRAYWTGFAELEERLFPDG